MSAVAVLGAGSWGTALALHLARSGNQVRLWGHDAGHISQLARKRRNSRYLPDVIFPVALQPVPDLDAALVDTDLVLLAVPSQGFIDTLDRLRTRLPAGHGLSWATKGLEPGSGRLLHRVVGERLGSDRPLAVISGPSFAREVALGLPTAVTVAGNDPDFADRVAGCFHAGTMRVYTSTDLIGVELGGAVKNVLAIATGIADGLGFGANARAAVITRGLAELMRLGEAAGGQRETFMGLTGVGDVVLSCTDDQSRNRRFGLAIGRGRSLTEARADIGQVVEGSHAVIEVMRLARQSNLDLPICAQVEAVLHHGLEPRRAVENLLARPPRPEH
jgi:glycerol-3-phosphate dehydrogenase (NAD(P)+)